MRFLLDANLSPSIASAIRQAGHDVEHVRDVGLLTATDEAIFDWAQAVGSVVVTSDSDFPTLLALRRASAPSVVLLREVNELTPSESAHLIVSNLDQVLEALEHGAIESLSPRSLRVRDLPI